MIFKNESRPSYVLRKKVSRKNIKNCELRMWITQAHSDSRLLHRNAQWYATILQSCLANRSPVFELPVRGFSKLVDTTLNSADLMAFVGTCAAQDGLILLAQHQLKTKDQPGMAMLCVLHGPTLALVESELGLTTADTQQHISWAIENRKLICETIKPKEHKTVIQHKVPDPTDDTHIDNETLEASKGNSNAYPQRAGYSPHMTAPVRVPVCGAHVIDLYLQPFQAVRTMHASLPIDWKHFDISFAASAADLICADKGLAYPGTVFPLNDKFYYIVYLEGVNGTTLICREATTAEVEEWDDWKSQRVSAGFTPWEMIGLG